MLINDNSVNCVHKERVFIFDIVVSNRTGRQKSEGKHRVNTCFNRLGKSEKKNRAVFLMISPAIVALGTAKE